MNPLLRPLEELVEKWRESHKTGWHDTECCVNDLLDALDRVLRNSGLDELLEAGQAMRDVELTQGWKARMLMADKAWDSALAKVRDLRVIVEQSRDGFINSQPYVLTYSDIIERLKEIELLINRKIVEHFRALINNNFSGQG